MGKVKEILNGSREGILSFCNALASPTRVDILRLLSSNSMNVNEIAYKLNIPISTASSNIKILEDADLVRCNLQPGKHGSAKLCSVKYNEVKIHLLTETVRKSVETYKVDMPIGNYFAFDIQPTCGLALENGFIGQDDAVWSFYNTERFLAQLIWFRSGYLEYRFPLKIEFAKIFSLQFSLECCSEAPGFRNEFPSDITFWVNDTEVCEWTSPGDFGGSRGTYTPDWWPLDSTQYGILKKLVITEHGTYLDNAYCGNCTLSKLRIGEEACISFKIGVKSTAHNVGGINIFGEKFGNYAQNIIMSVNYSAKGAGGGK